MTVQSTQLRSCRRPAYLEDLRGNFKGERGDDLLRLVDLRIQRINLSFRKRLVACIGREVFGKQRWDGPENGFDAPNLRAEFPQELQHLWIMADGVGGTVAECSRPRLHVFSTIPQDCLSDTDECCQVDCLPRGLPICGALSGIESVADRKQLRLIDHHVAEMSGARGGKTLAEPIPVVQDFNSWGTNWHGQRDWFTVVTGSGHRNPIRVAGTGRIELRAIQHPLAIAL